MNYQEQLPDLMNESIEYVESLEQEKLELELKLVKLNQQLDYAKLVASNYEEDYYQGE